MAKDESKAAQNGKAPLELRQFFTEAELVSILTRELQRNNVHLQGVDLRPSSGAGKPFQPKNKPHKGYEIILQVVDGGQ